ncbi:hypothetical protein AGMMS49928_13090 [Spirochaetia bacterium]|nr:hypothetical protein AGMMS49928_13090 [Spirochaetia bacterium]
MKILFMLIVFLFLPGGIFSQDNRRALPYLIPQTVFVGDRGRLVAPLGPSFMDALPFVTEPPESFSGSKDLLIRRIELERRDGLTRLLIDFTAYVPGRIILPPLEISPGRQITGLEISIASILNPGSMILAEPAAVLAAPGTSLLIYGSLGLIILVLFLAIGGGLGGRKYLVRFWEKLRRLYLLRVMESTLKRLRAAAAKEQTTDRRSEVVDPRPAEKILARFSFEMRKFISLFYKIDCHAWTAKEFLPVTPELSALLRRSDTLRFSGVNIGQNELIAILDDAHLFLDDLRDELKEPLRALTEGPA